MKKLVLFFVFFGALSSARVVFAQYAGGDNDGAGTGLACIQSLNGASGLSAGAIVGSTVFCQDATEVYTISPTGTTSATTYTWTVPAGATIVSGQGTTTVVVRFGSTNGNVSVDVANECTTTSSSLAVTLGMCNFYSGGSNDGFSSNIGCIQNLSGSSALIAGSIVGSTTFCSFATEAYSVTVAGATSSTVYTWSVPAGATIVSGQGTTSILVSFGGTDGNVSVVANNECSSTSQVLAVTVASCTFFAGGSNDGFSSNIGCIQNLNGGSALIAGSIVGSTTFCSFATEVYSISVSGATSSTVYTWSVPAGASIISGQGTTSILVSFGGIDGDVSVVASNECSSTSQTLAVTVASCTFFAGGSNDGFSTNIGCVQNLNGGNALIAGSIVGSTTFCSFASEAYSITVSGATSSTVYTWTAPPGATIVTGQGTSAITISFGGSGGDVSVVANNECFSTVSQTLTVSVTSCTFFAGGSNDGFATNIGCIQNLNGGSALVPGSIVGSTTFCSFATEAYSITVSGATSSAVYTWTAPPGATIASGQGTSSVTVSFGGTDGNVSVVTNNECFSTASQTLAVAVTSCLYYQGGVADGFSTTTTGLTPLPVELISFLAVPEERSVRVTWVTASETNNSFFEVEKSVDGETFQIVAQVPGAGTTQYRTEYEIVDHKPSPGVSYYRLVQHDFDGAITFSQLLKIQFKDAHEETIELYPNPVVRGGEVVFRFFAFEADQLAFSIVSPSGITLRQHAVTVLPGWNNLLEKGTLFETGVYLIPIRTSIKSWVMKLVVHE